MTPKVQKAAPHQKAPQKASQTPKKPASMIPPKPEKPVMSPPRKVHKKFQEKEQKTQKKTPTYSLLYRGNAMDGWMSAFIAHTALTQAGEVVALYPLYANAPLPAHRIPVWKGTHVLLLDLSVPAEERELLRREGILSIQCMDHHEPSRAHWDEKDCPVDTTVCTAIQVWRAYYPAQEMPFWLLSVDRLSRWVQPSVDDRCLREILAPLARMAGDVSVPAALEATKAFMEEAMRPDEAPFRQRMAVGQALLSKKDQMLYRELSKKGHYHVIGEEELKTWKLPREWFGLTLYVLDNSDFVIDTTEASHLMFYYNPHVDVFLNYRKRVRRDPATKVLSTTYIYSARSQVFDVRQGGFFQGQATSAGATVMCVGNEILPFQVPRNIPVMTREEYEAICSMYDTSPSVSPSVSPSADKMVDSMDDMA